MTMRALLGVLLLLACSANPVSSLEERQSCRITRIVDGDTVDCDEQRIRLLLIDTPERNQPPFGAQAAAALAQLIPVGSVVRLEFDVRRTDRYGRTLAYLHTERGVFVNEALTRAGYAVPLVYPPNVRHVERIRAAAEQARVARAGLWSVDGFACLPADARAGRC
ncbi:thermonuclease family protein [Gemmatimonas sp.]|jgi:micrococcal nuclease|uniref:thermonuclease family protein n=1 Tax=Gemmatimonas sp. TaxID=1962908 RepID=UPI0022C61168|nr:thermonuclease family protein [Gemmatimonas sp.]MCZ8203385.1 thermonuclease family protein [Gemmatimonas sp.]